MKDKIFNALKQEYARLGLGDNILLGLAEMLAGTSLVTEENLQGCRMVNKKDEKLVLKQGYKNGSTNYLILPLYYIRGVL